MRLFLTLLILLTADTALADDIYRWTDQEGNVHYSSKAPSKKAKPANLPKIKRENFGKKINKIKSKTPDTCISHGGVDCTVGADKDGSVICLDGYKDSITRFIKRCSKAKFVTQSFVALDKDDSQIKDFYKNPDGRLVLTVRNDSSVTAKNIKVSFKTSFTDEVIASGPKTIDPYGVGEYNANFKDFQGLPHIKALEKVIYAISCNNCPSTRKGNLSN